MKNSGRSWSLVSSLRVSWSLSLSVSHLLSHSQESTAEVSMGPEVPCTAKKSFWWGFLMALAQSFTPHQLFCCCRCFAKQCARSIHRQPYLLRMSRVEFVSQSSSAGWSKGWFFDWNTMKYFLFEKMVIF